MSVRKVLCEGPDDVAALRELATRFHGAKLRRGVPASAGAAGLERRESLACGPVVVELVSVPNAKSGLLPALKTSLEALPPQAGEVRAARTQAIVVFFDPDESPSEKFSGKVTAVLGALGKGWIPRELAHRRDGGGWALRHPTQGRVLVRAVPWRSVAPVQDGLQDVQNLERLCCDVAERASPQDRATVEGWLQSVHARRGGPPSWKAAVLLWSALLDPKPSFATPSLRFLGQLEACSPFVLGALDATALGRELCWLFGPRVSGDA